jgi:phosphate transport system protein
MPRATFDQELQSLLDDVLAMASMVDRAIARSVQALAERDRELAQEIIRADELINQAERDIDEKCLVLIATQQPMASDLRVILSVYSIASEMERMADHAEGIAKITLRMSEEPLLKPLVDIPRMAEKARYLLREQLSAFVDRDQARARTLSAEDEIVDELYNQVYRELLVFMTEDPRTIRRATYLLWAAHNLERIADRTTNIGERVIFLVTGRVEELNPTKSGR